MPRSVRPHPLEKTESIWCPKGHLKELNLLLLWMNTYMHKINFIPLTLWKYCFKVFLASVTVRTTTWKNCIYLQLLLIFAYKKVTYLKLFLRYWTFKNPRIWLTETKIGHVCACHTRIKPNEYIHLLSARICNQAKKTADLNYFLRYLIWKIL